MDAMVISRTGLDVEWRRMEVIALNLANMNSSHGAGGTAYVPLRLVSGPAKGFGTVLDGLHPPGGVVVYGVEPTAAGTRRTYEPSHPLADADGFVGHPAISTAEEMTLMVRATRVYQANLAAFAAAQQIYSSALQIGRGQ